MISQGPWTVVKCRCLLYLIIVALDSFDHGFLLAKLKYYGCGEVALNWFSSYLSDRSQVTVLNSNIMSSSINIVRGVSQGSILGPLLYIIFTADLPSITVVITCALTIHRFTVCLHLNL